jgi:hypothetical protein
MITTLIVVNGGVVYVVAIIQYISTIMIFHWAMLFIVIKMWRRLVKLNLLALKDIL